MVTWIELDEEYWEVHLSGEDPDEVFVSKNDKIIWIERGRRHSFSSGRWVTTEKAIALAVNSMPASWEGECVDVKIVKPAARLIITT